MNKKWHVGVGTAQIVEEFEQLDETQIHAEDFTSKEAALDWISRNYPNAVSVHPQPGDISEYMIDSDLNVTISIHEYVSN